MPTHRVRSRAARYPASADAITAIRTSAIPPATSMVAVEAAECAQRLTLTRPRPATRWSRNRLKPAETTAPAAIAPHDTAEMLDSSGMTTASVVTVDIAALRLGVSGRHISNTKATPCADGSRRLRGLAQWGARRP